MQLDWYFENNLSSSKYLPMNAGLKCHKYCRYYLATAADDSVVKLWDLRKLKNFKTIPLDESEEVCTGLFHSLINLFLFSVSTFYLHAVSFVV